MVNSEWEYDVGLVSPRNGFAEDGGRREMTPAFINHLRMAQGSLKELETLPIVAQEIGHLASSDAARLHGATARIGKLLRAYVRALQNRSET